LNWIRTIRICKFSFG